LFPGRKSEWKSGIRATKKKERRENIASAVTIGCLRLQRADTITHSRVVAGERGGTPFPRIISERQETVIQ